MLHLLLFFTLFLWRFATPAVAFQNPQLYYDWNNYHPSPTVLGLQVNAQESTPSATAIYQYQQFDYFLPFTDALPPQSLLYFLKPLQEQATLTFTFNPYVKEERRLSIAGERLAELEALTDTDSTSLITRTTRAYGDTLATLTDHLDNLASRNQDISSLATAVDLETSKHTLILEQISLQASPPAESGLATALAASEHAVDTVADVLGRPPLPPEIIDRLQALKAQGVLTTEEVTNLTAVDTRRQAREQLRKYTDNHLFPSSDFKKLDETARVYFPQAYSTVVEIKKFRELKDLETQQPDDATLRQVQNFALDYQPGDIIPSELRRWWIPLVRLEELQNTLRPDLLDETWFKNRPDDQQKYSEVVERSRPRLEDIQYVSRLVSQDPQVLNDPAYARIYALANRFGAASTSPTPTATCSTNSHWVSLPYMPNGGYCVPNYNFPTPDQGSSTPCPPAYHRNSPDGICYPDNPGTSIQNFVANRGSCPAGYRQTTATPTGSSCQPEYPTYTQGPYPNPMTPPIYCPAGQYFGPGGICTDTQKSSEAYDCARSNQYWNGTNCQNTFPSPSPYTSPTIPGYSTSTCQYPSSGCSGGWFDWGSCSCKTSSSTSSGSSGSWTPSYSNRDQQESICRSGGGTCSWSNDVCNCQGYQSPSTTTTPSTSTSCGSGYYWNGSYCASSNSTTSTPTYNYMDPATACAQTSGCSWTGSTCQCSSSGSSTSTPTEPAPTPASTPTPVESTPAPTTESAPPPTNTSTMDPASACSSMPGCSWDGSGCHCP